MKYRALIVDDERIIVNGIMRLPIWLSLDIEPVPAMTGLRGIPQASPTALAYGG